MASLTEEKRELRYCIYNCFAVVQGDMVDPIGGNPSTPCQCW